jgi:hypothetical protein
MIVKRVMVRKIHFDYLNKIPFEFSNCESLSRDEVIQKSRKEVKKVECLSDSTFSILVNHRFVIENHPLIAKSAYLKYDDYSCFLDITDENVASRLVAIFDSKKAISFSNDRGHVDCLNEVMTIIEQFSMQAIKKSEVQEGMKNALDPKESKE